MIQQRVPFNSHKTIPMISSYRSNRLLYLSGGDCVLCEVGTDFLSIIYMNFNRKFHVLKASTNGAIQINETTESCVLNRQSTLKCNFVQKKTREAQFKFIHKYSCIVPSRR